MGVSMLNLVVVCDEERIFDDYAKEVDVITDNGPVTILPQHQPYMAKISGEVVYITDADVRLSTEVANGFVYTNGRSCFVVVNRDAV
jgi:F0F1-type ATP synthase epsilon subunit